MLHVNMGHDTFFNVCTFESHSVLVQYFREIPVIKTSNNDQLRLRIF